MADSSGSGGQSVSSGLAQVVFYLFAVVFVLLVLAGAAALVKYVWRVIAA